MMNQVVSAPPPTLDSDVPRIIVTEPSPLVHSPDIIAANIPSCEENARLADETTEAVVQEPSSRPTVEQFDFSTDSSGESLVSIPDNTECGVHPINGLSTIHESRIDLEEEEDSDETVSVPSEECNSTSTSNTKCCSQCGRFFYASCLALNSKYAVPFWVALMILPVSSVYMGLMFHQDCKLDLITPWLLLMIGIMGIIMLIIKILIILLPTNWVDLLRLHKMLKFAYFQGLFYFCGENGYFWRYSTSSDDCNPYFYHFTIWWNVTTIPVVIVISVFQVLAHIMSRRN